MWLSPGDTVIVTRADPYRLADKPGSASDVVIEPGQVCRALTHTAATWPTPLGRSWGNDADGSCRFLIAVYELPGQVTGRLLEDLPEMIAVRAEQANRQAVDLLTAEAHRTGPGQELIVDRLADLVLVDTLRAWLAGAGEAAPAWYRPDTDSVTGTVLRLIHDHPDQQWTLVTLACAAVSRATLARRFALDVGTPPITYLTEWRLARAADLLRTTKQTVERIAQQVGYSNAFAFSTAFKRRYGSSPREHRGPRSRRPPSPPADTD